MKEFKLAANKANKSLEDNEAKTFINTIIAKNGNKALPSIVLDGPTAKTLKILLKYGYKKANIFIPNLSDDFQQISKLHTNTYHMSLYDFLFKNRKSKKRLGILYMDYMCSLEGNIECKPRDDLKLMFDNRMMSGNSVLAITLSARSHVKNDTLFKHNILVMAYDYIMNLAADNKYRLRLLTGGLYRNNKNNIYSLVFKVNLK